MTNNEIDIEAVTASTADQLCGDDLLGGSRNIRIVSVSSFADDKGKLRATLRYDGDNGKPFIPAKTCARIMVALWGKHTSEWVGKTLTVYRDPEVMFGGAKIGGVRISHASDINETLKIQLATKRGKKDTFIVKPLATQQRQAPAPQPTLTPEPEHDAATGEITTPIDAAADYVATTLLKIAAVTDRADLAALQQASARASAKLSDTRPELSSMLSNAFLARMDAFDDQSTTQEEGVF